MKTNNNQKEKAGVHKQMNRMNKFIHLSLIAFAILLNHSSFSQSNEDSVSNGNTNIGGVYANSLASINSINGDVKNDMQDYQEEQTAYPYPGDHKHDYYQQDRYSSFSIGTGELFHKNLNGPMQVSFPYTSTDASGKTTSNIFTSNIINPFPQDQLTSMLLNFEVGLPSKYFIDFNVNLMRNINYFSLGCGYQVNMGSKEFVIKPSINLSVECNTTKGDDLGNIDNANKTVNLLGYESDPTFVIPGGKYHSEKDENTQYLEVDYSQDAFVITPQIGISNNQYEHRFHWEFDIGYNLAISEAGGVELTQYGQSGSQALSSSIIGFGSNNYTASCNNKIITSDPNKFSSFYMGISIGYNANGHYSRRGC
ncbi:MAG: hypothetical protein ABR968_11250 [Bacteroidales bacterium]